MTDPAQPSPLGPRLSAFRTALFLLLPNHIVWHRLLNDREREALIEANGSVNNERPDFTPADYQKGNSFESAAPREPHLDGKWIIRFLRDFNPTSVLECGPGSGFHTRSIVEHPSVRRYAGIDVNQSFITYLEGCLTPYVPEKIDDFKLFLGDVKEIKLDPVEAVIFSSSLHHIPDRDAVFKKLVELVRPGGLICCVEPTHYWPRFLHLWRKVRLPGYIHDKVKGVTPLSTHHFCTWQEFRRLELGQNDCLRIIEVEYDGYRGALIPRILAKIARLAGLGWPVWLRTSWPVRLFSSRMYIVYKRLPG
jgi:SAM-dependent methyltransferase